MRICPLVLCLLVAACQSTSESDSTLDSHAPQPQVPARVTGLRAERTDNRIELSWKPSSGAFGYDIYRQSYVWHPGDEINDIEAPWEHIHGSPLAGYSDDFDFHQSPLQRTKLIYRVIAGNIAGYADASDPVTVVVTPLIDDWASTWLSAAQTNPNYEYPVIESDVDYGNQSRSTFPEAVSQYSTCVDIGVGIAEVRPAIGTMITAPVQTFSYVLAYNTGGATWRYEKPRVGTGTLAGCGTVRESFTVQQGNPPYTSKYDSVSYVALVKNANHQTAFYERLSYAYEDSSWVRIAETTPAAGTALTDGTLRARLEYHNVITQSVSLTLFAGDLSSTLAHIEAEVAGSGAVSVAIPYETQCGSTSAILQLSAEAPISGGVMQYPAPPTSQVQVITRPTWVRRGEPYLGSIIDVYSCSLEESINLKVSPGWQICGGNECSALVGEPRYSLTVTNPGVSSLPHGRYAATITASFAGGEVTKTVAVNVYEYFWETAPPPTAYGGFIYPLAITVSGPRPTNTVLVEQVPIDFENQWLRLAWNGDEFAGASTYERCGFSKNRLLDRRAYMQQPIGSLEDETTFSTIVTGTSRLHFGDYGFSLDEWGWPATYQITEQCGYPFHWEILSAPSWVRFKSLSGSHLDFIHAVMVSDDSTPWGKDLLSHIAARIVETGEVINIRISVWYR